MPRRQKILAIALWATLIVVLNAVVVAYAWERWHATPARTLPTMLAVPTFALTDQDGRPVSDQSLRGEPWIAAFIFTNCAGTCPMMSAKMQGLQGALPDVGVKLVSFTVDPQRDTPAVLKKYAARFNADAQRWLFLTGTPAEMKAVADGMHVEVIAPVEALPMEHSTHLFLVDAKGQVRGIYDTDDKFPGRSVKQLAIDAADLAKGRAQ